MKPSDAIREGRNLLFEHGWNQGHAESDDGRICVLHSVLIPAHRGNPTCDITPFLSALNAAVPTGEGVTTYNDAHDRTFDDIVDLLDRAEKIAEQAEANDA